MKRKLLIALLFPLFLVALLATTAQTTANESEFSDSGNDQLLNIQFFPLGNGVGDSFIISYGDVQILVDAGYMTTSSLQIKQKMQKLMNKDKGKVWDYIIVTHGDSDHIAAFSNKDNLINNDGIFAFLANEGWTIGTLIDFDTAQDSTISYASEVKFFNTQVYKHYTNVRDLLIRDEIIQSYYTASQCCWAQRGVERINNATNVFSIADDLTLTILYNYFYDHRLNEKGGAVSPAEVNCISVCFLIQYKEQKFLFTGDLEEFDSSTANNKRIYGETKLYENNKDLLSGGVTFYKGAHHGSRTSNSKELIDLIRPSIVVIPTIAGYLHRSSQSESWPTQEVLDNFLQYTSQIYIPSYAVFGEDGKQKTAKNYYGEIIIQSDGTQCNVITENECDENGKPKNITETAWLKENRKIHLNVHVFDLDGSEGAAQCTLVKYGSIDILLDCGADGEGVAITNTMNFLDEIQKYCRDGVLEYVIISSAGPNSISQMIGNYKNHQSEGNGIFDLFQINTLIDFGSNTNNKSPISSGWLARYYKKRQENCNSGRILSYISHPEKCDSVFQVAEGVTLEVFNTEAKMCAREGSYSICTLLTCFNTKMLFTGDLTNDGDAEKNLIQEANGVAEKNVRQGANGALNDITMLITASGARADAGCSDFLSTLKPEYTIITSTLGFDTNGTEYVSYEAIQDFLYYKSKVYALDEEGNGADQSVNGDMVFTIVIFAGNIIDQYLSCENGEATSVEKTDWYKSQK